MSANLAPARRRRALRRQALAGTVVVSVLAAGGSAAYAAWSASGTGSTEARSATAASVTLNVSAGTPDLYPGATGAVYFTVTNPNPYPITITSATFGTVSSNDETACPAVNVSTINRTGLSLSVPASSTSGTLSITGAVSMAAGAPDGCQNRIFTIATTVSGTSA